jgi:hypothetical protein
MKKKSKNEFLKGITVTKLSKKSFYNIDFAEIFFSAHLLPQNQKNLKVKDLQKIEASTNYSTHDPPHFI